LTFDLGRETGTLDLLTTYENDAGQDTLQTKKEGIAGDNSTVKGVQIPLPGSSLTHLRQENRKTESGPSANEVAWQNLKAQPSNKANWKKACLLS